MKIVIECTEKELTTLLEIKEQSIQMLTNEIKSRIQVEQYQASKSGGSGQIFHTK